ncbi:hypothetical protein ACH5RR_032546 [Cinchona calisaya]|uniref:RNase H type-1 domain-containing protein n=1 Tax=Cinchona calisaya TaxID=153742 RepID=A0ABD2YIC6_9GENT
MLTAFNSGTMKKIGILLWSLWGNGIQLDMIKRRGEVGVGVVIRDCNGAFVRGFSRLVRDNFDLEVAEDLAARAAVLSLRQLGRYPRFILEATLPTW